MVIREGTGSREGRATGVRYGGAVPVTTGGGSSVSCGFWVAGLGALEAAFSTFGGPRSARGRRGDGNCRPPSWAVSHRGRLRPPETGFFQGRLPTSGRSPAPNGPAGLHFELTAGTDVSAENGEGRTPLQLARRGDNLRIVRMLREAGAEE